MNINQISGGSTWSDFIRLADEARSRNSGLTPAGMPVVHRAQAAAQTAAVAGVPAAVRTQAVRSVAEAAPVRPSPDAGRILGTRFDAYA